MLSGFGGSLLSSLSINPSENPTISVGASGALFGLLGAMLSELITNWTIYSNKVTKKMQRILFPFHLSILYWDLMACLSLILSVQPSYL